MAQHERHPDETLAYEWSARLAKCGFTFQRAGYVRRYADGIAEFIVSANRRPGAPTDINEPVVVEDYDEDGQPANEVSGYTLADVLTALEDPRDDYYLLALRLENFIERRPTA